MALPQTASLALAGPLGPIPGTTQGKAWYNEDDEGRPFTEVARSPFADVLPCHSSATLVLVWHDFSHNIEKGAVCQSQSGSVNVMYKQQRVKKGRPLWGIAATLPNARLHSGDVEI